ncbi:phosphotransferase family protein [Bacillus sp. 2205SS5-2]|uniref:phosphotransferase family protein n=1 Tax=Bacillus sp. 2205SS5-2 TaxID=3109031 RepID=UPI003004E38C
MSHIEQIVFERNLKLLNREVINGAHAGRIERIKVLDEENQTSSYIYKEFATDRNNEIDIYSILSDYIKPFSKLVKVWDSSPEAILMSDLRSPIKKDFELLSKKNKRKLMDCILHRLAELHSVNYSQMTNELPSHQITSEWYEWCLEQINRLFSQNHWTNLDWIKTIEDSYVQLDITNYQQRSPSVITHGDPHFENIFLHDEEIWFIDWEWAATGSPLRDITILLQDLYDSELVQYVSESYRKILKNYNLHINSVDYRRDLHYMYIDHSTMMLAWEIEKFFQGYTSEEKIKNIINFKIREIRRITCEELS